MLVWGFFISTTALFHGTSCINSMAHLMGRRRFQTEDHHRYMSATRQGFYWWEIAPTYYCLKALSYTGLIRDLKGVPKSIFEEAARTDHDHSVAAAAKRAAHPHHDYSSLRKVVPTAAAFAVATVNAAQVTVPRRAEGAAIHKDVTGQLSPKATERPTEPASENSGQT